MCSQQILVCFAALLAASWIHAGTLWYLVKHMGAVSSGVLKVRAQAVTHMCRFPSRPSHTPMDGVCVRVCLCVCAVKGLKVACVFLLSHLFFCERDPHQCLNLWTGSSAFVVSVSTHPPTHPPTITRGAASHLCVCVDICLACQCVCGVVLYSYTTSQLKHKHQQQIEASKPLMRSQTSTDSITRVPSPPPPTHTDTDRERERERGRRRERERMASNVCVWIRI